MPITGNKRVTQLVELTSNEVIPEDLLYIVDVNANESKRIKASEFGLWLKSSGSFYAIRAILADTASYILGSNIDGLVNSSSYALSSSVSSLAQISSQSLNVISSSYALTASFALNSNSSGSDTASYLLYQGVPNGTASYALNAFSADSSTVTSFLQYFGGNNGTASFAITTQNVLHTLTADTASYFNNIDTGSSVATSSYAFFAQQSDPSNSASFLVFLPNNGTASYAMAAQGVAGIKDYGIFLANTQSSYLAQLDDVDVIWSIQTDARTPIEAIGTVIVPFTSSIPTNGTIYLSAIDRNTGFETLIDSTPISVNLSPTIGNWGSYNSGTIKTTFSLIGQPSLYGSYIVFVSSSNNIQIESTRIVRFDVSSESDTVSSYVNVPLSFSAVPNSITFSFTNNAGTLLTNSLDGMLAIGAPNIRTISAINQNVTSIEYFWTLLNVTASNFSNNPFLTFVGGVPNVLTYFSCSSCDLVSLYSFASSSLSVFDCNSNRLTSLPDFPPSVSYVNCSYNSLVTMTLPLTASYLNCSFNQLTSLPDPLPSGSYILLANDNSLTTIPVSFPDTIISMSFDNNTTLTTFLPLFMPSNLEYFSINNCPVVNLPTIPPLVLYLSSRSCSLNSATVDSVAANLVSNTVISGTISGTVDIRGNGLLSPAAISNMTILQSNGWTTLYDT
jgi:hypothetical protein